MSTLVQKPNLCNYCHQKPKRGGHDYCGKTCGQQAAAVNQNNGGGSQRPQPQTTSNICKQCNQKPKFPGFDFCGKNCATTWQLAHGGSNGTHNPGPSAKNPGAAGSLGKGAANVQVPNQLLGHLPQPLQAQLQVVLPAVTAALQQQGQKQPQPQQQPPPNVNLNVNNVIPGPPSNVPQPPAVVSNLTATNPTMNPPQQKGGVNQNVNSMIGPGLPVPQNAQGSVNNLASTPAPGQFQAAIMPTTCRLNGCTKAVYTDPTSNYASEYCSKRHREEAVITGQVKACIMCLKMPRSNTDHFCSKACRDAALSQ